jgi:hypothetical protein
MIQYVYIVKCPDCEDEFFDFFDEAKDFAVGCLSKQPIITQVEVDRNDFGECTDSCDLGTIWSWEETMKDIPSDEEELTTFCKADTFNCADCDAEFDELDNSVCVTNLVPETSEVSAIDKVPDNFRKPTALIKNTSGATLVTEGKHKIYVDGKLMDEIESDNPVHEVDPIAFKYKHNGAKEVRIVYADGDSWTIDNNKRSIPEGMTIKDLVEAMEENEDEVECTWCNDLFDKSECRYEVDLGYLCSRCEAAIKSRGETLTFRENNYWDFLDEDMSLTEASSNYTFRYLAAADDAKSLLLDKVKQDTTVSNYDIFGGTNYAYLQVADEEGVRGKRTIGVILDINIKDSGRVEVIYDDLARNSKNRDLEDFLSKADDETLEPVKLVRNCGGYEVLNAIKKAASELNSDNNIKQQVGGIRGLRTENTLQALRALPQNVLDDLLSKVSKIEFKVPLINVPGYEDDFSLARLSMRDQLEQGLTTEPLSEEAIEKLETICDNFVRSTTGQLALDAGIVKNRPSDTDTNKNICDCWGAVGKVTFSCPVASLNQSIQDIIKAAVIRKAGDDTTADDNDSLNKTREVSSYRLASALVLLGALDINGTVNECLTESIDSEVDFDYEGLDVTLTGHYYPGGYYSNGDPREPDWDEEDYTVDFTYKVDRTTVEEAIIDLMSDDKIVETLPEDLRRVFDGEDTSKSWQEENALWDKYFAEHFDRLVEKYNDLLKEYFKEAAIEYYQENTSIDDKEEEAREREFEFNWYDESFDVELTEAVDLADSNVITSAVEKGLEPIQKSLDDLSKKLESEVDYLAKEVQAGSDYIYKQTSAMDQQNFKRSENVIKAVERENDYTLDSIKTLAKNDQIIYNALKSR